MSALSDREQWYTYWFVGLLLTGLVTWAIGASCRYTRARETACAQAGGALLRPPPMHSGENREMCARVLKFEFEQVPLAK